MPKSINVQNTMIFFLAKISYSYNRYSVYSSFPYYYNDNSREKKISKRSRQKKARYDL